MKLRILWIMFLGMLGLSSALAQTPPPTLIIGEETTGSLSPSDFWQNYVFAGSEGNAITLDLVAENEDLSLILLLTAPNGEVVAQDADLSSPNEALIPDFSLPQDGQYLVTVLHGEGASGEAEGDYTLILSGELSEPSEAIANQTTEITTTAPPLAAGDGTVSLSNGGIEISLEWAAAVNLDLEVRDPQGNAIFSGNPASVTGGSLNGDANATCATATAENPSETISWGQGTVPTGSYEIILYYVDACDVGGPQQFTLTGAVNGETPLNIAGTLNPNQRYMAALEVQSDATWQLFNGGVNAGLDVSLLSQQIANAQPFTGIQVTGTINRAVPAIAYTLEGVQGDTITLNMDATSGNLDPYLILLNATGAEVARNDDRLEGNTNSTISQTLPQNGIYTIVATRYGQTIGGTEGNFNLTLSLSLAGASAPTVQNLAPVETTGADTLTPGADTLTTGTNTLTTGADTLTSTTTIRPPGLPVGSVEVLLTWATQADIQLLVRDPAGAPIYDDEPSSPSGGILQEIGNAQCNGNVAPVSYIYWPSSRLPRGIYEIDIWFQRNCEDTSPVTFNLVVNVQGEEIINQTQPISLNTHYGITFEIDQEGTATAYDGGFFDMADSSTINYFQELQNAEVLQYGDTAPGNITAQERFAIYSFEGITGDRIRIAMTRTGGTLDTALFLVSAQAGQLAANDDIVDPITGERNTNSLIEFTIPSTGTYYIIATHYGLQYGGTTGSYNLILAKLPPQ